MQETENYRNKTDWLRNQTEFIYIYYKLYVFVINYIYLDIFGSRLDTRIQQKKFSELKITQNIYHQEFTTGSQKYEQQRKETWKRQREG